MRRVKFLGLAGAFDRQTLKLFLRSPITLCITRCLTYDLIIHLQEGESHSMRNWIMMLGILPSLSKALYVYFNCSLCVSTGFYVVTCILRSNEEIGVNLPIKLNSSN